MSRSSKDLFPSKFLKSEDIGTNRPIVTISRVEIEPVGQGKDQVDKAICYFAEPKVKPIVLNKTNSLAIANGHGRDYSTWRGKQVEIYPDRVAFQGEMKDCLRVRVPVAPALPEDDIPF